MSIQRETPSSRFAGFKALAICAMVLAGWAHTARAYVWSFTNKNSTVWAAGSNWNPTLPNPYPYPPLGTNNYPGRFNVCQVVSGNPAAATATVIYDAPTNTGFGTIINATPEFGRGLSVANGTGTTGTLQIVNGTITVYQAALIDAAIVCAPADANTTSRGFLILDGGNLTLVATNYGILSCPARGSASSLGVVTVQNGSTLTVDRIRFGSPNLLSGIAVGLPGVLNLNSNGTLLIRNMANAKPGYIMATNNFNGGKIKVRAAEAADEGRNPLIDSNIVNNVLAGGLVVDNNGFDARIASPLLSGVAGLDGGITKIGSGTLKLLGMGSTYTGPTIVSSGTLGVQVPMSCTDIRVQSGAGLNFIPDNVAPWSLPSLGLTNVNLGFDYGSFSGYSGAVVSVGALNLQGTIRIHLVGNSFPVTTLTLLTYGSKTGSGSFALGTLPSGAAATLTDTGSALVLNITKASLQSLTWWGGDGIWRTNGAADWNFGGATYLEYGTSGDIVLFDDTGSPTVNITGTVRPASLIVDNPFAAYIFSGSGRISGATGIEKNGTGTLQINTSNDFTGQVFISGGGGTQGGTLLVNHASALGTTDGDTTVLGPANTLLLGIPGGTGVAVTGEKVSISGTGVGGALGALRGAATTSGANVWAGPVFIGDGTVRIGAEDGGNLTVSGNISDNGYNLPLLVRPGLNATVTLAGTSNYWGGGTTLFGGDSSSRVLLGTHNALPTNGVLSLGGNCTLDLHGFNLTCGGLAWAAGGNTAPPALTNSGSSATLTLAPAGNQTFLGDIVGNLALTKQGTNSQTLTGATLTYTGVTTISQGLLNFNTGSPLASSITVANGGILGGTATTAGTLTLNANATVLVDPSSPTPFTANTINGSGSPINISFASLPPPGGDVLVLSAVSGITGSASNFRAPSLRGGTFSLRNGNRELHYVAPLTATSVTWKGNDPANPASWDLAQTTNWSNGSAADKFYTGDVAWFDDSGVTKSIIVQDAGVLPSGVVFSNATAAYTVFGGAVGGDTILKTGAGSVTLANANTYSGLTIINNGVLTVQNNAALGSTAAGTVVTNTGALDLGGTLGANSLNLGAEVITISGAGFGGNGAVVNIGGLQQINAVQQLVLAANASIGGSGRWDMRGSGNTLDMASFNLTKSGSNQVALVNTTVLNPGNISLVQGTLGVQGSASLGGSSANTLTVENGAKYNNWSTTEAPIWTLVLNHGSTFWAENGAVGLNNWAGPVILNGTATLQADGGSLAISGDISGTGSILKTGGLTATLSGLNRYAGDTTVNQGILAVQQATLATNSTITVAGGATLQLDFAETNTVAALVMGGVSKGPGVYSATTDPSALTGSGSLRVVPVIPPALTYTLTGTTLKFSWTGGGVLQVQTNSSSIGLSHNWVDYPGGGVPPITVPIDPTAGSVFFRVKR